MPVGNIYAQYQWPGVSNITATLTSGSPPGTGFYSFPGHFSFNIASGQQVSVYLNGTSACGSVDATCTFIQSSYYYLVVSPNPASNNINVAITEVADTTGKMAEEQKLISSNTSGITQMYLYDFNTGILVKQWNFKEMKSANYNLNIAGVKSGVYLLKMERNNKATSTKIIVK
ncbi:MAG TPA: T9SS type A sorting domain-containing protein [Hanamia sp.]|nr:T9SS type A sorting domain-containing protein [Hanamia sp.]